MAETRDIHWGAQRLSWVGDIVNSQQLRRTAAGLFQMIEERPATRPSEITLDFSKCTFTNETVVLPLLPIIADYREIWEIDFSLVLPEVPGVGRLFTNANWAHHIAPQEFEEHEGEYRGGHVPALRFEGHDERLVRKVLDLVSNNTSLKPSVLDAYDYALKEIMENVSLHAQSKVGGFLQATALPQSNSVEFIIADRGIGIPTSLGLDDVEALERCIEHGVTRSPGDFYGNGLDVTFQLGVKSGGSFDINSNWAYLIFDDNFEELRAFRAPIPYWGTIVRCRIGLDNPDILIDVLHSGYRPMSSQSSETEEKTDEREATDVASAGAEKDVEEVEATSVSLPADNESASPLPLVINVRQSCDSTELSIAVASSIREQVAAVLSVLPEVILDFEGMERIPDESARELLSKLFIDLGPRRYMTSVKTRSLANDVIDSALLYGLRGL